MPYPGMNRPQMPPQFQQGMNQAMRPPMPPQGMQGGLLGMSGR
jgi:hypothetical protein